MQNDPIAAHVSELFALGKMLSTSDIKAGKVCGTIGASLLTLTYMVVLSQSPLDVPLA